MFQKHLDMINTEQLSNSEICHMVSETSGKLSNFPHPKAYHMPDFFLRSFGSIRDPGIFNGRSFLLDCVGGSRKHFLTK